MRRPLLAAALLFLTGVATAGELKPFVRGSWQSLKESHAGRPLIIHFWGLTCGPCRPEMQAFGKLLSERPDLPLVTINADIVPDPPEAALDFLDKTGLASAENCIFDDSFVERLRYEIDPKWQGEIPLTLLIGRDGMTRKIEGAAKMPEISAWFDEQQKLAK
jgi:thiol-disulfide isomerase/thioredoxin